jgi:hypothetical protein
VAVDAVGVPPGTTDLLELPEAPGADVGAGDVPGSDVPPQPAASRATTASDMMLLHLMARLSFDGARRGQRRHDVGGALTFIVEE